MIALDTETTLPTDTIPVPQLVSVAFASEAGAGLLAAHDPAVLAPVRNALRTGVIFANAPFDLFVLLRHDPTLLPEIVDALERDRVYDVLLAEKLLDVATDTFAKHYDLGAVSERRCGLVVDKTDPWRLRYVELLGLEISQWPAAAREYALRDAVATYAVWLRQQLLSQFLEDLPRQVRHSVWLYAHTLRGMLTDQVAVEDLDQRIAEQLDRHAQVLLEHGLARWQGKKRPKFSRSLAAAGDLMLRTVAALESVGLPAPMTMTQRGPSLSEDAIEQLNLPDDHPLRSYQRWGSFSAMRTKNIPPFRHPIVRCRYKLVETGRTSSSAPGEPWHGTNLQNLMTPRKLKHLGLDPKRGFRECLVPRPGCAFVISDFAGMELVALAQVLLDLFGWSNLADAIRNGRDAHADLGCRILGIPAEQYDPEKHKDARQLAKVPNFGYPGGLGPRKFVDFARTQYNTHLTEVRARELKQLWLEQWPEMSEYFAYITSLQGPGGRITIRQHRSNRIRAGCSFTEACNSTFQGLGADGAKASGWELFKASLDPRSVLYGCPTVLFAHDEHVLEAPIDRAQDALVEQERIMISTFAKWCPDVPIKVESKIVSCYTK